MRAMMGPARSRSRARGKAARAERHIRCRRRRRPRGSRRRSCRRDRRVGVGLHVGAEVTTEVAVHVALRTVSEMNARGHWGGRASRMRVARLFIAQSLRVEKHKHPPAWPNKPRAWRVQITRYSAGMLDTDNLQSACKGVRDGVADFLRVDDGDPRITWGVRAATVQARQVFRACGGRCRPASVTTAVRPRRSLRSIRVRRARSVMRCLLRSAPGARRSVPVLGRACSW